MLIMLIFALHFENMLDIETTPFRSNILANFKPEIHKKFINDNNAIECLLLKNN